MHEKGDGIMVDKWLDMLGLYDFLGVICPGIFAAGMALFLWHVNIGVDEKLLCVWSNNSIYYNLLKYFSYVFVIVAIYVLGSCVHELGHFCKMVVNTVANWSRLKSFKISEFAEGSFGEAEKLFLKLDLSNSSLEERKVWFKLVKQVDFCRNNREYYLDGELDDNIKKDDNIEKISPAFYQHCKRVVLLNGCGDSSKKKESIYGFSRNMSVIFGSAIIFVLWCYFWIGIKDIKAFSGVGYELAVLMFFFVVFSSKSIRYKNMEIVDTIRTYRYLAENQKK